MSGMEWPYPVEWEQEEQICADVLVVGGGPAGCMAAIAAAKKGQRVVLLEKGATKRSGAAGSGVDHWESAATNPCSKVSPEELVQVMIRDKDGFINGISHYIECREGYDRLLDMEAMGGKVRDKEGEFEGADFRDPETGLLFAYDYRNRFTIRVWGSTFQPALQREMKRLGVRIMDRVMCTDLLTENGVPGGRVIGATGIHTRTGKFYIFSAKATILATARPSRLWLFSAGLPALSEMRPLQCSGDAHAMGWRAGAQFTLLEKAGPANFHPAGRSYPPYGAGDNQNTWYAADLIDARGRKIPYVDRDGKELQTVAERFLPVEGQRFFIKGGAVDRPKYEYQGPDTPPIDQLVAQGYELPFYSDLSMLPEMERKAVWGLMIGEEAKTKIPVYQALLDRGFDPMQHVLQCYGKSWSSANALPDERQFFGLTGGFVNDWTLRTNLEGLYAAGDSLFSANCYGHAAATGSYAGRHAAAYAAEAEQLEPDTEQIRLQKQRIYAPIHHDENGGVGWKEINMAVNKLMKSYCGQKKQDTMLQMGLEQLEDLRESCREMAYARNPRELTRTLEAFSILDVAELVLHSCLARKSSNPILFFDRIDHPEAKPEEERKFYLISKRVDGVKVDTLPLDYYGDMEANYLKYNSDYVKGGDSCG